ncbi:MAG: DUF4197 domain-containing protein [Desulfobacterales bacterium]|nr:DUF4197 domain-containing protein [Desulfobacterales bacterium]
MKTRLLGIVVCIFVLSLFSGGPAMGGVAEDILKILGKSSEEETLPDGSSLSEGEIIQGLKEALKIGAESAVTLVSALDGYYKNPDIKIILPEEIGKMEEIIRKVGLGGKLDDFEESMNRAAENAAPEAKKIFWDAIGNMNFSDAKRILNGADDEATRYFREHTGSPLMEAFKPIVDQSMSEVGGVALYQALNERVRKIPFMEGFTVDINEYVTGKALDGLFIMLADEEKKIREDPAARATDILKKVFGSL